MAIDPRLLAAIVRFAPANLRNILGATSLVEHGGQLGGALGDFGASAGPYQENIHGRGAGLTVAQREDPIGSTRRAVREFAPLKARGFRGGELAYRAQRPADHPGYVRKIAAALPEAARELAVFSRAHGQVSLGHGDPHPDTGMPVSMPQIGNMNALLAPMLPKGLLDFIGHSEHEALAPSGPQHDLPPKLLDRLFQSVPTVAAGSPSIGLPARPVSTRPAHGRRLLLGRPLDRPGVATAPSILDFAERVAETLGSPIHVGTGTAHNQFVSDRPGHQSAHWTGHALDLPATGATLTRMGQAALIAAGMPPAQARKQTGGVFNVGGYNILFNTSRGGNHFNHLHIGERT